VTFDLRGAILDRFQARAQAFEEIEFGINAGEPVPWSAKGGVVNRRWRGR